MQELIINGLQIELNRKKIKSWHLSVCPPDGRVKLSVPINANFNEIHDFIHNRIKWIERQQKKFIDFTPKPIYQFCSGEYHYYQGKSYLLNVIEHDTQINTIIPQDDATLNLYVALTSTSLQRQAIMHKWYKQQLEMQLPALIARWQPIVGIDVREWRIKQMKTRWGTCNIDEQRIWLNLELAKAAVVCLEYIIVHEMVHLLEAQHNKRFYAYMDQFMPEWRTYKNQLNEYKF